jgi:hypothetical protein
MYANLRRAHVPIALAGMKPGGTAQQATDHPGLQQGCGLRLVSDAKRRVMPREAALGLAGAWARILAREADADETIRVTVNGQVAAARSEKSNVAALRSSAGTDADARKAA